MKRISPSSEVSSFLEKEPDKGLRRQDQEELYIRNGAVYIFSRETLIGNKLWGEKQYGLIMDSNYYNINIDSEIDLITARAFYEICKQRNQLNLIE